MDSINETQINSRIEELDLLLQKYKFDRNCQNNAYQSTIKQLEHDQLKVSNEQQQLKTQLEQLKTQHVAETDMLCQTSGTCTTFRRDMLWQTKLSMLSQPSCYNSEVVEQFNQFHEENTTTKSLIQHVESLSTPLVTSQVPEARRYFNTVLITVFISSNNPKLCKLQIECIQRHIDNSSYEHVVVFYRNSTIESGDTYLAKLTRPERYTLIPQTSEPKVIDAAQFCTEQIMNDNNTSNMYILASPLCHAELNINMLKKFDMTNRCVVLGHDKHRYWDNGYVVMDGTTLCKKFDKRIKLLDSIGVEHILHDMKKQHVECLNLTTAGYLAIRNEASEPGSHHELQLNREDSRNRKQLPLDQITYKNFVNGDCCEWSPGMIYYEDRLSGNPGKFFETRAGRLFYATTKQLSVFYLCCEQEIQSGSLYKSLVKFLNRPATQHHSFNLHVCVDRCASPDTVKSKIESLLKSRGVCYVDEIIIDIIPIPVKDNIFTYDIKSLLQAGYIPPMGASHGENQLFYDGLRTMSKYSYENFLMLETDCQPTTDYWFDRCMEYCENSTDFVIAGRTHKGASDMHRNTDYADHLNGVAIYKNDSRLLQLLDGGQKYVKTYITKNPTNPIINFDVANYMWVKENDLQDYLMDVSFISNYSSKENQELTVSKVLQRHPETVILHKKFSKTE